MERYAFSRSHLAYGVIHRSSEDDAHGNLLTDCTHRVIIDAHLVKTHADLRHQRLCANCARIMKREWAAVRRVRPSSRLPLEPLRMP